MKHQVKPRQHPPNFTVGQRLEVINAHVDGKLRNGDIVYMVNQDHGSCIGVSRTADGPQIGNRYNRDRFKATSAVAGRTQSLLLLLERV